MGFKHSVKVIAYVPIIALSVSCISLPTFNPDNHETGHWELYGQIVRVKSIYEYPDAEMRLSPGPLSQFVMLDGTVYLKIHEQKRACDLATVYKVSAGDTTVLASNILLHPTKSAWRHIRNYTGLPVVLKDKPSNVTETQYLIKLFRTDGTSCLAGKYRVPQFIIREIQ